MKPLSKHRSRYEMPSEDLVRYLVYHSNVYEVDVYFQIPQMINWGNSLARFEVNDVKKCDSSCEFEGLAFRYRKGLKADIEKHIEQNRLLNMRKMHARNNIGGGGP